MLKAIDNLLHTQMSVVALARLSKGSEPLALQPTHPPDPTMKLCTREGKLEREDAVVLCSTAEWSDFTPDQTWMFSQVKHMNSVWALWVEEGGKYRYTSLEETGHGQSLSGKIHQNKSWKENH